MTSPRYTHDCDCCHFLGGHSERGEYFDLYAHVTAGTPTVIARFGNDGPEYSSGLPFSYGGIPELTEARFRAQEQGLLPYSVRSALFYINKDCARSNAELLDVLMTSKEVAAYQAHQAGQVDACQSLILQIVEEARSVRRTYDEKEVSTLTAVCDVQSYLVKVLKASVCQDIHDFELWKVAQEMVDFIDLV